MSARDTPVMRQHAEAKREYPDALIFFRLGDFYELFGDDAIIAAPILELVLTSRNKGASDEIPMAGVPHHAAHGYIGRLLEAGYKVALCEQMADPAKCKGIVPRQVVRVITPGLVTDRDQLDANTNNWLAAVATDTGHVGLAMLDLSTGELASTPLDDAAMLLGELARVSPRECLFGGLDSHLDMAGFSKALSTILPRAIVRDDPPLADQDIQSLLSNVTNVSEGLTLAEQRGVARVMRFAQQCSVGKHLPLYRLTRIEAGQGLVIDEVTQAHLELVHSLQGGRTGTLLSTIDVTKTPGGARLMRRWLLSPLREVRLIRRRQDTVEAFVVNPRIRTFVRECLGKIGDLERLVTRAVLGEGTPRDLGAIRQGLETAHNISMHLASVADNSFLEAMELTETPLDTVSDIALELTNALVENPPAALKDGSIFRPVYDDELREYDDLRRTGTDRISQLETQLRESTGIATLKIRFTQSLAGTSRLAAPRQ